MDDLPKQSTLCLEAISAQADDRSRLDDRYVEEVWSEFIGPTAVLLARRFGRMVEEHPDGAEGDPVELATALGVQTGILRKALERLHRFEIVHLPQAGSLVGVSGFAPSVRGGRVLRLSEGGRLVHDRVRAASQSAGRVLSVGVQSASERRSPLARGCAL